MNKTVLDLRKEALDKFYALFRRAKESELKEPTAMILATADRDGQPSIRTVLLKDIDERGFVFFTNERSRKGREMAANPRVALCFYWETLEKQVLVRGKVSKIEAEEADSYWVRRPRESQIGAWASAQSSPMDERKTLEDRFDHYAQKFSGQNIPRPPHWSGFLVSPDQIEFWTRREHRLHERLLYQNTPKGWIKGLLFP